MGEVRVPADALWQAQTQRAVENFPISGSRSTRQLIAALGLIKEAAAQANAELGVLEPGVCRRDRRRPRARSQRQHDARVSARRLPDRVGHLEQHERQRGDRLPRHGAAGRSGASQRSRQRVAVEQRRLPQRHPHCGDPQPGQRLLPALRHLEATLGLKATEFADVVKCGRTHLMDATPVTLGQEFGGYAAQIRLRHRAGGGGAAASR